ncbi:MAG: sugar ABC transporter permease [Firmicutes bacterium]|nr:sugar ABC transporter permease [Bacillota bacterium]
MESKRALRIFSARNGAATVTSLTRQRSRSSPLARQRAGVGVMFVAPVVLLVVFLLVLPIIEAIYYSFTNWNGLSSQWVGLATYEQLLTSPVFWRVLLNNAVLLIAIPFAIFIPLSVAFLLNQKTFGWAFFRSVYFLPTAISWVVIGMVSIQFFAADGLLSRGLQLLGLPGNQQGFLGHSATAIAAVAVTFIWSVFGTNTIIFVTGMATIGTEVLEAARVDGATGWTTITRIMIPLLGRFIQFAFVTTLITAFTALFSLIFVMTGGGPGYGTTTLEFYVYQEAFSQGQFGTGAALGVVLFLIVFGISLFQLRLMSRDTSPM